MRRKFFVRGLNMNLCKKILGVISLCLPLFLIFVGVIHSEEGTGSISGTILPAISEIVPPLTSDLMVIAIPPDEKNPGVAKVDEKTGKYNITGLKEGTYTLGFSSLGTFVLLGVDLDVDLIDPDNTTKTQISDILDSFDQSFENGYIEGLTRMDANGGLNIKEVIATIKNTNRRAISKKETLVQKGDNSKIALIRRITRESYRGEDKSPNVEVVDQLMQLKKINGRWKIIKAREISHHGNQKPENPQPFVYPYVEYLVAPIFSRVVVRAGEEESGHDLTLPPKAIRMHELKIKIMREELEKRRSLPKRSTLTPEEMLMQDFESEKMK